MCIFKYILAISLLLNSSFFIFSGSVYASVNLQKKVYGTRGGTTTSNAGVSDPTNQDKVVSSNSNTVKVDSTPTPQSSTPSPIISKAPVDASSATVTQENLPAKNVNSKPVQAIHPVKSVKTSVAQPTSANALESGDYRASIYFKDGSKRDGTILSTSTSNIYEVRFAGEKNVKQYNVNSIARIERKGETVTTTNVATTSMSSNVLESGDYRASIYFKDGSKRDGTILSTSTNNIYNIKFAGEKDIKQYSANTIERIERKGEFLYQATPVTTTTQVAPITVTTSVESATRVSPATPVTPATEITRETEVTSDPPVQQLFFW